MMKKFSLVEIIVVIAIIAILAGITIGVQSSISRRNKEMRTRALIKQIELGLEECKAKFGYFPAQAAGQFARSTITGQSTEYKNLFYKACEFEKLTGHMGTEIVDGWGNPLYYESDGKTFKLFSSGPDGLIGATTKKIGDSGVDANDFDGDEADDIGTF